MLLPPIAALLAVGAVVAYYPSIDPATQAYDQALVDIGLPAVDGYEVAKNLRASEGGDEVYLVAVSGYGRPEDRARALDAGFDAYVVKPVDEEALRRALGGRGEAPGRRSARASNAHVA